MTVYNINLGIGWASSGVEYAQAYRAQSFRKKHIDAKFVFMEWISYENIQHLTANMGFQDDEVIWLYQYFSDIPLAATSYTEADLLATIPHPLTRTEQEGKVKRFFFDEADLFVTAYLTKENEKYVDRAEFVSRGLLIRKDYYSFTRVFSEFYAPKDDKAHLYQRRFYNRDGSTAYEEIIDGENTIFKMKDAWLFSKEDFISYFIKKLNLTSKDIVIMDRATDVGQAIFEVKGDAKIGTIVHADHYSDNVTTEDYILWNNYYEYEFQHAHLIDFFVTSTDAQTQLLQEQFEKYTPYRPKIYTIPVGSYPALRYPETKRRPFSLITASRLATEKHIDWLVQAVVKAKVFVPELTFDIYGEGGERQKIEALIEQHQAAEYIRLKGHQHMANRYTEYEVYIAGSTSEGFGLTLMEAVGSGLPIIGFDVPYGNPTFVTDGVNGFLIPKETDTVDAQLIDRISDKIVQIFMTENLETMHEISYQVGANYLASVIDDKWQKLVEEVTHD